MKKIGLSFFLISSLSFTSNAQFYYKDILSNKQLQNEINTYKQQKVKTISIKSFEDDGSPSEGFFCVKKFSKDYTKSSLFTRSNMSEPSELTSVFNKKGMLLKSYDSSVTSVSAIQYQYDDADRILAIVSSIRSYDEDYVNEILEEHIYQYGEKGQIESMTRIKNKTDSTTILFATDEHNNVIIEKDTRSGTKYYYYYDSKKRLTDIVQENDFKTNLVPDYVFEYNNSAGMISQMTTSEEGGKNYFIWKYSYDNGLRIREKCFNKERKLMGSIEYEYK